MLEVGRLVSGSWFFICPLFLLDTHRGRHSSRVTRLAPRRLVAVAAQVASLGWHCPRSRSHSSQVVAGARSAHVCSRLSSVAVLKNGPCPQKRNVQGTWGLPRHMGGVRQSAWCPYGAAEPSWAMVRCYSRSHPPIQYPALSKASHSCSTVQSYSWKKRNKMEIDFR